MEAARLVWDFRYAAKAELPFKLCEALSLPQRVTRAATSGRPYLAIGNCSYWEAS